MKAQIILADPNWHFNQRADTDRMRGGANRYYATSSTDEICQMPVPLIADTDALLFLWTTSTHIFEAEKVIAAWGFKFVNVAFYWIKTNSGKNSTYRQIYEAREEADAALKPDPVYAKAGFFFGPGHYTRANVELCLFGRKGKTPGFAKPKTAAVSELILAPRREHSQKPYEAHKRIEAMYPDYSKVELYARQQRPGWTCLGNEIDGRDLRDSIPDLAAR